MPLPTQPAGARLARVIAADIHEGDELHHQGEWWPVTSVAVVRGMVELKVVDLPHLLTCGQRTPVLVRWRVPLTTRLAR